MNYTANYIKIESGYMGQILEWPEVVTEGNSLDECRSSLKDALEQMTLAYRSVGKSIPNEKIILESIILEPNYVS